MRAVIVDRAEPSGVRIGTVPEPEPAPHQALIRVRATSLNPGECRRVAREETGFRPGWDFAGDVLRPAADGSGPPQGARVFGNISGGSWSELVVHRADWLAPIPEGLGYEQVAVLPIAGLTPLRALERGGFLLGRRVLVTGASGVVGSIAIQLARLSGALVVAIVRRAERAHVAEEAGATAFVGDDCRVAAERGPFDLILDGQSGAYLSTALDLLAKDGICVFFGTSASNEIHWDPRNFYLKGGGTLYGLALGHELTKRGPRDDLVRLADLVRAGRLAVRVDATTSWRVVSDLVRRQLARETIGKIVMQVD